MARVEEIAPRLKDIYSFVCEMIPKGYVPTSGEKHLALKGLLNAYRGALKIRKKVKQEYKKYEKATDEEKLGHAFTEYKFIDSFKMASRALKNINKEFHWDLNDIAGILEVKKSIKDYYILVTALEKIPEESLLCLYAKCPK